MHSGSEQAFELVPTEHGLALKWLAQPQMTPLLVDFLHGKHAARAERATIKNEAIAKAVGLKPNTPCTVFDATAGLGRDALVLASLGASVTLQERHRVVAELLQDALQRLQASHSPLAQRLQWGGHDLLASLEPRSFDVVYIDPMYPKGEHKRDHKSAVKKDMQMFHALVGQDDDGDSLLEPALRVARNRVVVKRPQYADKLAGIAPDQQIISNKQRFDIYLISAQS